MIPIHTQSLGPITDAVTGEYWTPEDLQHKVAERASALLNKHGIGPGSRVVILHSNSPAFFADLFAIWTAGACAACADPSMGVADYESLISTVRPDLIITQGGLPAKLATFRSTVTSVESANVVSGDAATFRTPLPDDPALILFTSGSTGLPKGVVHTFRTLASKWKMLERFVPLEVCETTLCALPTHFGHGLICNSLYPLVNGKHLVIMPKPDVQLATRLGPIIDQHAVTFMSSVPAIWRMALRLSKRPTEKSLQQVHIGSAPLSADLWRAVAEWTGTSRVWNTYGITEVGSWVAGPVDNPSPQPRDGFVGRGWGSEILVAPDGADPASPSGFQAVPEGQTGHVWLRTPDLMANYLGLPDETNDVVRGVWFKTGDIGSMEKGQLILAGRVRNEINKGGIKISPEEIDLTLEQHPAVMEACTFARPDPMLGEDIGVCIVLGDSEAVGKDELAKWVARHLSDAKVPRHWYFVDEIPKTSRGKVNRRAVADFAATQNASR